MLQEKTILRLKLKLKRNLNILLNLFSPDLFYHKKPRSLNTISSNSLPVVAFFKAFSKNKAYKLQSALL